MEDGCDGTDALAGLPAAYASWRASTLGQITDALELDFMLEMIGPKCGLRVLDVGCGDGVLAAELWKRGARVALRFPDHSLPRRRLDRDGLASLSVG